MAQIINHNPEDNPRLNEIYEILLVAGYFRIRIASLKAFDKVVGGMAWCITSSNFEIEVQYNDEMQIGQKIRVSQVVCDSLTKMKCPYSLQPFQLQGLDVNNIFPIVQWLVKFVYETRFERQKYDRQLSLILGKPITQLQNKGNPQKLINEPIQRSRINRAIQKINYRHPVRVYSALLEYNDASATKMYNKLLNIMANKGKLKSKGNEKDGKGGKGQTLIDLLGQQGQQENTREEQEMNEFGNFNDNQKLSLDKLEKIIMENKTSIQEGIREHDLEQQINIQNNANKETKNNENNTEQSTTVSPTAQEQREDKILSSNQQQKWLKQAKNENKKYQQKIQILHNQLQSFQSISIQLDNEIEKLKEKHQAAQELAEREIYKNNQYKEAEKEIQKQLKVSKTKVNAKLEKLVQKRQELKNKKTEIKKKAKAKIDELNYQSQQALATVPEIDEQAFKQMLKQAQMKKAIYDKKYEELTLINQQLAILQRKAQNYTSPPQIAQYHQRFVQLFEAINVLIEEKRSMFSQISNLQSLKKVVANYLQIMNNMKVGYTNVKKKSQLKQFTDDIKQILQGLKTNMTSSQATLSKIKGKRESVYGEYMDLIKLERDYLHLLRILKIEYQNAAKYYK